MTSLRKYERLTSRKIIERLFKEGKTFVVTPYRVHYLLHAGSIDNPKSLHNIQFGVSAARKNFKRAVDRNRIKRVVREAYRLQKNILYDKAPSSDQYLFFLLVYTGNEMPSYEIVYNKMTVVLQKLTRLLDTPHKQ